MEATTAVAVRGANARDGHQTTAGFEFSCCLRDLSVGLIGLALQLSQFVPQLRQQHAQQPGEAVIGILQYGRQRSFGMAADHTN
ncbi:MAG TPA: hypothetical protein VGF88_20035 [Acidobacteriaceae bacterium]|jgi:hypothetical protein